jgi:predicted 3-demethylubiquinone-9 3-methyltransferase (glyoxalase superfamily)
MTSLGGASVKLTDPGPWRPNMAKIPPFLWFDAQAEEAAEFYVSVFPSSRVIEVARYGEGGPGPAGSAMTVRFSLDGTEFLALDGGPMHAGFNLGVSFMIDCTSPEDVDHYWTALTEGGEEGSCGWLKDKFGLSWQVVPDGLPAVLGDADPARAQRAMAAMLGMKKLDLSALLAAADNAGRPVRGRPATG